MKDLIEYIVKAIVDNPDDVDVRQVTGNKVVVVEVRVASDDVGKVIGREGRIANALRIIAKAAAIKDGLRASVEIIPPDEN